LGVDDFGAPDFGVVDLGVFDSGVVDLGVLGSGVAELPVFDSGVLDVDGLDWVVVPVELVGAAAAPAIPALAPARARAPRINTALARFEICIGRSSVGEPIVVSLILRREPKDTISRTWGFGKRCKLLPKPARRALGGPAPAGAATSRGAREHVSHIWLCEAKLAHFTPAHGCHAGGVSARHTQRVRLTKFAPPKQVSGPED
jgi:hypothetical protein